MSKSNVKTNITPPTNNQQGDAFRFLVGAIKANLLGMFYNYTSHSFVTLETLQSMDKTDLALTAPKTILDSLVEYGWDKANSYKMWCPVVFQKSKLRDLLQTLQLLFGDKNPKHTTEEQKIEAATFVNAPFYFAAILIVLRHLNSIDDRNAFRAAYLELKGLPEDTHFVYRFMDEFVIPKTTVVNFGGFDIITETEARALSDPDCYKKFVDETKGMTNPTARSVEIRRLMSEAKCVIYIELSKPGDSESPLVDLSKHQFIFTNNWEVSFNMKDKAMKTLYHFLKEHINNVNVLLPLEGDNTKDIPAIKPFEAGPTSSSKPPTSDGNEETKKKESEEKEDAKKTTKVKRKADIKLPPRNAIPVVNPEKEREEREKKLWADDISGKMIQDLLEHCTTPQDKAKVLQALNVAAGLSTMTTKCGGNVFNLNSRRLLKAENNNTGIIIGYVDGSPLFKNRQVALAVNVKNKKVPITWFKESKIGTNTNLTSNNADLAAWVKEQLIPKVWKTFAASFAEDVTAIHGGDEEEEEDDDQRINGVSTVEQDENEEPDVLFDKKRDFDTEMDFISAHAAMLPIINFEGDLHKFGGSLDAQRAQRFNINRAAMDLDREELKRLEIVRANLSKMFTPDSQSIINIIRKNIKANIGEPVGVNGVPFEMELPEKVEEAQFTADYRSGVAGRFEPPEFDEEDEDE